MTWLSKLLLPVMAVLVGVLIGVGAFTFGYANGWAYFGSDPATCGQCHAMTPYLKAWEKGSHTAFAGCNDCHAPHDSIVAKYINKGENGFWHSLKFTTGDYPTNIQIRPHNAAVVEAACRYCHGNFTNDIEMTRSDGELVSCVFCHPNVGHME